MPCPVCIGAIISTISPGAGLIGVAKHVHDKAKVKSKQTSTKKPKSKS